MKKFFATAVLLAAFIFSLSAQSFYYISSEFIPTLGSKYIFGHMDATNCKDSVIRTFYENDVFFNGETFGSYTDLAIGPDGSFYTWASSLTRGVLLKFDAQGFNFQLITDFPFVTSLTCDANGVIYGVSDNVYSYNILTGSLKSHGPLPPNTFAAGDITFIENDPYLMAQNNIVFRVDLNNPSNSQVAFTINAPMFEEIYGIVNYQKNCDDYFILGSGYEQVVYDIDANNGNTTILCNVPNIINGMASPTELQASDCQLDLDLDANNNTQTLDTTDFRAKPICQFQPDGQPITDADLRVDADYRIDSARISIISGILNGPDEQLFLNGSTNLSISGNGTASLFFQKTTSTTASQLAIEFENALKNTVWKNTAANLSPGLRTIRIILFGKTKSDTAFSFLEIAPPPMTTVESLSQCVGKSVFFDGNAFQNDTLVCQIITLSNGCDSMHCASISFFQQKTSLDTALCTNETLFWQGINWPNGSGQFIQKIIAPNGCEIEATVNRTQKNIAATVFEASICAGATYFFAGDSIKNQGIFRDTLLSGSGCDSILQLSLSVLDGPSVVILGDSIFQILKGDSHVVDAELIGGNGLVSLFWMPDSTISCGNCLSTVVSPAVSTLFTLTAVDAVGCIGSDQILVEVKSENEVKVFAPNAFTPDGDGLNDRFQLFADPKNDILVEHFLIFDRWGELVFEEKNTPLANSKHGWDGRFRGKETAPDVFVWSAKLILPNGERLFLKGDLTLIR